MTSPESFEDFKNSFSYGSRTDLNFKFLAKLSDKEAIERIDEFVKEAPSFIIAVRAFRDQLEKMTLPRVITTPHLLGRPLGAPGDRNRQRESIMAALDLLETAHKVGTLRDLPGSYRST